MLKDKTKKEKGNKTITESKNVDVDVDVDVGNESNNIIKNLDELKNKICLNNEGKIYYLLSYSIIEETTKKIEETFFFDRKRKVDKLVPEFINEITITSDNDKVESFIFDENGKNLKVPYYTIEDVVYNFMVDRERYLTTKESLSKLGYKIEKNNMELN